jgi:hypothetical protein
MYKYWSNSKCSIGIVCDHDIIGFWYSDLKFIHGENSHLLGFVLYNHNAPQNFGVRKIIVVPILLNHRVSCAKYFLKENR